MRLLALPFFFLCFTLLSEAQVLYIDGSWQVKNVELYERPTNKVLRTTSNKAAMESLKKIKYQFLNQNWQFTPVAVELEDGMSRTDYKFSFVASNGKIYKGYYALIGRSNDILGFIDEDDNLKLEEFMNPMKLAFGKEKGQRYLFTHIEQGEGGIEKTEKICIRITLQEL
ncbi:MAG: hypothetical protein SFU27_10840 [Thermonemataceae bacterium]|nr:hypothetical protein [Thermonemataceae bacterium]